MSFKSADQNLRTITLHH